MSGGLPPAKPCASSWFMSAATVTSTVLPLSSPQAATASSTAFVSASPDEAISIDSSTGPSADDCSPSPSSSKPSPPQAVRPRTAAVPSPMSGANLVRVRAMTSPSPE